MYEVGEGDKVKRGRKEKRGRENTTSKRYGSILDHLPCLCENPWVSYDSGHHKMKESKSNSNKSSTLIFLIINRFLYCHFELRINQQYMLLCNSI